MINDIICILTNLFRVYLIYRFVKIFYGYVEVEKWKEMSQYSLFLLINTSLYFLFHQPVVNLLCNLIGIGCMVRMYTRSVKEVCFITSVIYILNMICEFISVTPFIDYEAGKDFNQMYEIITVFLFFICEVLTEKIVSFRKNVPKAENPLLILVPICSIFALCVLVLGEFELNLRVALVSIALLLINIFSLYVYNILMNSLVNKYDNEILQQRVMMYSNELNSILESENKIKALRHDLVHHMNEIKIMAGRGDGQGIERYIDDMTEFMYNSGQIVSSGNKEIDSLLNYMLQKARNMLDTVNVEVKLNDNKLHLLDINVILGNLLENAIEAASKSEKKLLNVFVEKNQGLLKINISNSYNGTVLKFGGRFVTTKLQKDIHGIGLENVKRIVKKYNGIMDINTDKDMFDVKIVLYME